MKIRNAEPKDAEQLDMMLTRLIQDESRYDSNLNRECEIKDNYLKLRTPEKQNILKEYAKCSVFQGCEV